jgi:hypothetical protein
MSYQIRVPRSSAIFLFAMIVLVPSLTAVLILEASGRPLGLALPLVTASTAIAVILTAALWIWGAGTVSVGQHTIVASAAAYRFETKRDQVIPDKVKRLAALSEAHLTSRRNGIGLPNYRVGWFSMLLGGAAHRAFLLATSPPYLLVPFKNGEVLVVSCPADRAHEALRALAAPQLAAHPSP